MPDEFLSSKECLDSLVESLPYEHTSGTSREEYYSAVSAYLAGLLGVYGMVTSESLVDKALFGAFSVPMIGMGILDTAELINKNTRNKKLVDWQEAYYFRGGFSNVLSPYEKSIAKKVIPIESYTDYSMTPKSNGLLLINGVKNNGFDIKQQYEKNDDEYVEVSINAEFKGKNIFLKQFIENATLETIDNDLLTNDYFLVLGEKKSDFLELSNISPAARTSEDVKLLLL